MARKRIASRLRLLTLREIQTAGDGDHSDGGGLLLRMRGQSASWVLRYTSTTGRRREMGLGVAHRGSASQIGDSITGARALAAEQRALIQRGLDPIDERAKAKDGQRQAQAQQKADKARERLTLARAAREYHERVIEASRTTKHAARWIASLENHVPAATWHAPIASIDAPALLAALLSVRALDDADQRLPETLRRVRQRLDSVFEDAISHGHCTTNPAAALRRKMHSRGRSAANSRRCPMPRLRPSSRSCATPKASRRGAWSSRYSPPPARMRQSAPSGASSTSMPDAGCWAVPAGRMKGGELHTVHLTPRTLEILTGQAGLDNTYVFPSPTLNGKALSNMAMLTLLDRMDMRNKTTVHGLCRATFSTWANETAAARPDVVEACLARRESDKVRASYKRAKFNDERRELLIAWATYLNTPRGHVIALRA